MELGPEPEDLIGERYGTGVACADWLVASLRASRSGFASAVALLPPTQAPGGNTELSGELSGAPSCLKQSGNLSLELFIKASLRLVGMAVFWGRLRFTFTGFFQSQVSVSALSAQAHGWRRHPCCRRERRAPH